jgi:hypothetical protein
MGSPAEPFFGQRELNFSAGRRIGGRLSEIFPQPPETVQVPRRHSHPAPPGATPPQLGHLPLLLLVWALTALLR